MCTIILRLVTILVLGTYIVGISSNHLESRSEKRSGKKYCGPYLADIIQLVCGGRYNTLLIQKKSGEDSIPRDFLKDLQERGCNETKTGLLRSGFGEELMNSDLDREDELWQQNSALDGLALPFRPRPIATALVPRSFRRLPRGAHDECCLKSCTIDEIGTYCAP